MHRLFNSGRYADALSVAEQQLRLLGESYGHSHQQGASRLSGTRPRRVRGPTRHNHHEYATAMNNVATLYQALGRYGEAEPLLEQASKIQQRTLGNDHPHTVASLSNLATVYQAMGNGDAAAAMQLLVKQMKATWEQKQKQAQKRR